MEKSLQKEIEKIADFYGRTVQVRKVMEELSELSVAVSHYEDRGGTEDRKHLIEELADAEIMVAQIKYMYGISRNDVQKIAKEKVHRQIDRIQERMELINHEI